ncbi:MAG TPA: GFA family protein [Aliiroseovarius sp.]|nr:GFA family protein [Aliiroseovarius sp.]
MHITGHCHCGAVSFEADLNPAKVAICHCEDCQRLSGSAFRTVAMVSSDDFTLLSGSPKEYIKVAESGNERVQAFCGDCGSPLYATSREEGAKVLGLRVGVIDQRADLVPGVQVWHDKALGWLDQMNDMPVVAGQPPAPAK